MTRVRSDTRRSRAPSGISGSRSMMPWLCLSKSSSDGRPSLAGCVANVPAERRSRNAYCRPRADLHGRHYERAVGARKRSSAERDGWAPGPTRKQSSERVGSDDRGPPEQWEEESFDLFVVAFGSRLVRDVSFPTNAPGALK